MVMPSCSEVLFLALLSISSVSVVHTAARPLIPNVQPLNCGFCMSVWVALGIAAGLWTLEALLAVPFTGFFAVVASGQWPWAFYTTTTEPVGGVPVAEADQPGKV